MRFLVDVRTGPLIAQKLRELHHEVFSVYDETPELDDESIIEKAYRENYILVTNDKDFGEYWSYILMSLQTISPL